MVHLRMPQTKTIIITAISIVLVGGMSFGTFVLLSRLKPAVLGSLTQKSTSNQTGPQVSGPDADRQRAEQLLKEGKLADAKTTYQAAADGYKAAGNNASATDAARQVTIIDAMIKSQAAAKQQPYQPHQSGSTK